MAIRYSGDVEIRVQLRGGVYHGAVRAPGYRERGQVSASSVMRDTKKRETPEAYDKAALLFLRVAIADAKKKGTPIYPSVNGGRLSLRRTFQAPCPYRT